VSEKKHKEHIAKGKAKSTASGSFGVSVCVALVLALFLLSVEGVASVLMELGGGWALFWGLMDQILPKIVIVMGAYLILRLISKVLLVDVWRVDGRGLDMAIVVFLASAHGLWLVIDRARVEPIQVSALWTTAVLLACAMLGCLAYRAGRVGVVWRGRKILVGLLLAAPVVILETLGAAWLNKQLGTIDLLNIKSSFVGMFSGWALLINIAYLFVIGATSLVFVCTDTQRKLWRFVVFLGLLLVTVGVVVPIAHTVMVVVERSRSPEQHSIGKVILIVIDALRTDVISCYGSKSVSTPNIDSLGTDGVLFERAYSSAPWTVPSISSILTGVSPLTHRVLKSKDTIPENCVTLAERMKDAGYLTGAIGDNPHLSKNGYQQGFGHYDFYPKSGGLPLDRILWLLWPERFSLTSSTSRLTQLAQALIERWSNNDFFLWLHYFDPHNPYFPPSEYLPKHKQQIQAKSRIEELKMIQRESLTVSEKDRYRELYEAEVRYVDDKIGELLDYLKNHGYYEKSLIVLTSDHGEEFWDHGGYYHGRTLHNELIWVPLIIKLPDSEVTVRLSEAVGNERILPTILELCRIDYDSTDFSGTSLSSLWSGEVTSSDEVQKAIFSTGLNPAPGGNCEMVLFDDTKFIRWLSSQREELYDLEKDPEEKENISGQHTHEVERAKELLRKWAESGDQFRRYYGLKEADAVKLDAQTIKQLRSLGYVDNDKDVPEPKQ
jgi:arylsulfatase A-like enzyme